MTRSILGSLTVLIVCGVAAGQFGGGSASSERRSAAGGSPAENVGGGAGEGGRRNSGVGGGAIGGFGTPPLPEPEPWVDPAEIELPEETPHVAARRDRLETAWRELNAKFDRPVSLDLKEVPLGDALAAIAKQIDAPLELDEPAATEEGISLDDPVSVALDGLSAETAFERLLEPSDLTAIVRGDRIVVTTATIADEILVTRVYPVSDLVAVHMDNRLTTDFAELVNLIMTTASGPWMDTEGEGGQLTPYGSGGTQALAVRQTFRNHREIELLLHDLRQARSTAIKEKLATPTRNGSPAPDDEDSTDPGEESP